MSVVSAFAWGSSPALLFLLVLTPFDLSLLHFHLLSGFPASLLPVAWLWRAAFRFRRMCSLWLFLLLRLILLKQNILKSGLYFVSDHASYIPWFLWAVPFSVAVYVPLCFLPKSPWCTLIQQCHFNYLVSPLELSEGNQLRLFVCIHLPLEPYSPVFSTHAWAFVSRDFILKWLMPFAFIFRLSLKGARINKLQMTLCSRIESYYVTELSWWVFKRGLSGHL